MYFREFWSNTINKIRKKTLFKKMITKRFPSCYVYFLAKTFIRMYLCILKMSGTSNWQYVENLHTLLMVARHCGISIVRPSQTESWSYNYTLYLYIYVHLLCACQVFMPKHMNCMYYMCYILNTILHSNV